MTLISEGLAKKIGTIIEEDCRQRWNDFVHVAGEEGREEVEFVIDEDAAIRGALDVLINDLSEELGDHATIRSYLIDAKISVREIAQDALAYDRNRMAYYGMKQSDFV